MKDMAQQLKMILDEADGQIVRLSEEAIRAVAKETAQRIRTDASVKRGLHRTGEYASGWTLKKKGGRGKIGGYVVYNRSKPGLTHLLEKGHVIKNAKGTYGRTAGIPHIKPAESWSQQEIMRKLSQKLKQMR